VKRLEAREVVAWILGEPEPSVRVDEAAGHYAGERGGREIELYGVADKACVTEISPVRPG
jgi:hypothetical protein